MSAQVKQQVVRFVRITVFGALAVSPAGQAVANDLHSLAAHVHALFVTPGAASVVLVALAENVTRSVVPSAPAGKAAARQGTAARLLVWVSDHLASLAQRFVGTVPPAPPAA